MRYLCKPYSLTLATMIVFFITGCNRKESQQTQPADEIIAQADLAAFPHFTSNHLGEPVLWWAETDTASKSSTVYFAVSKDGGRTFGEGVPIPVAAGFASHSEGMAKLAFKGDGTMILLFQLHRPTEDNYFSSQLMYSQSFDNGQSWTEPKRIHSNSDMNTGHGFADMTIGPDGEAIAVWLDGRNKLDYSEVLPKLQAKTDSARIKKLSAQPASAANRTWMWMCKTVSTSPIVRLSVTIFAISITPSPKTVARPFQNRK